MKKWIFYQEELSYIKDDRKRQFCIDNLELIPEYFWSVPASSTGKYHPKYSLGEGGLARHVKGAIKVAVSLFEIYNFTQDQQDNILVALLFHDCMKSGTQEEYQNNKYTKFNHPLLASKFLIDRYKENNYNISVDDIKEICKCVTSHMGKWNVDAKTGDKLPKPETEIEKFTHMCDYLASRRFLEVNFEKR